MIYDSKDIFKCSASCANNYHGVTTFEVDSMVENMKNRISQK